MSIDAAIPIESANYAHAGNKKIPDA